MNPRHPIDEFFRERLEGYEVDPPLHVWGNIQEFRAQQAPPPWGQRHRSAIALAALLIGAFIYGLWPPATPTLASFPIPESLPPGVPAPPTQQPVPVVAAGEATTPPAMAAVNAGASPTPQPALAALAAALPVSVATSGPPEDPEAPQLIVAANHQEIAPLAQLTAAPESPLPLDREPKCVRFGQQANLKFYIDAGFTPQWAFRTLQAKSPEYEQYAELREETERPRLSYGAGARLSMVTDFGLALRSGISFTQINEKFNYTDNSEEKITITNIYGPNGEFIRTDTLIEFGAHQQTAHNRYRMVDIPLILGYEIHRKKWTLAFNGGALFNLSLQAKGEFYSPEAMQPLDFPSDNVNTVPAYRQNIGVGWFASIGLHYHLGGGLQLMLEPQLRSFPQSITHEDYVLDQQYLTSGLTLGLRKRI